MTMKVFFALGSTSLIHTRMLTCCDARNRLSSFWYVGDKSPEALREYVETGDFPSKERCLELEAEASPNHNLEQED